jgi:hypothetical protein
MVAGDNGVTLNDTRDGRQLNSVNIHANDAALSADGRLIGVAANGGVFEWEPLRGRKRWLRSNALNYDTVAWSPDGLKLVASAEHSLLIKNKDQRTAPEVDILAATTGWEISPYTAAADPVSVGPSRSIQRVFVSLSQDGGQANCRSTGILIFLKISSARSTVPVAGAICPRCRAPGCPCCAALTHIALGICRARPVDRHRPQAEYRHASRR